MQIPTNEKATLPFFLADYSNYFWYNVVFYLHTFSVIVLVQSCD